MEHIADVLCSCVALLKNVQSSPQLEGISEALKILEDAFDEIHVGVLEQQSWRV